MTAPDAARAAGTGPLHIGARASGAWLPPAAGRLASVPVAAGTVGAGTDGPDVAAAGRWPESLSAGAAVAGLRIVLQPIVELATGRLAVVEALARFPAARPSPRPVGAAGTAGRERVSRPDEVIASARAAGLGTVVEAACVEAALRLRPTLPTGVQLTVNLTPAALRDLVCEADWVERMSGVIVEVTELDECPATLALAIDRLRSGGALVAADDVGSGFSGLMRLAAISPEFVKVDRSIVLGAVADRDQFAVLEAITTFAHRIGARVIAEGVESTAHLPMLAELDVDLVQGFALGRPAATVLPVAASVVTACRRARLDLLRREVPLATEASLARSIHQVTVALAGVATAAELTDAVRLAARTTGVDTISVSVLDEDALREVTTTKPPLDPVGYRLAEYRTTERVMRTGAAVEVHVADPAADPAEVALLRENGLASLLIVPFHVAGTPAGIVELGQREQRRWSSRMVVTARGFAEQIGVALHRVGPAGPLGPGRQSLHAGTRSVDS